MADGSAGMRFNSVAEWLRWQETLHPEEIELGLQRVQQVFDNLKIVFEPPSCRVITVAGSNGKGSCVAYLSALFQALGYRVGSYSSPHLLRYNERIQINGQAIADDQLMQAFAAVERARHQVSLTYFEFGTLAALQHFADNACDVLVLEVGLGGRLDAVNIIDPDIAVITSIGLDHMDWLGDTREQIAEEKAGILRHGRPFVCSEPDPPVTLLDYAERIGAHPYYITRDFKVVENKVKNTWHWYGPQQQLVDLPMPAMPGEFQLHNFAAALMCLALLRPDSLQQTAILADTVQNTRLPGRLQILSDHPLCLVDVAHNEQAVMGLARVLSAFKQQRQSRIYAVFSLLSRKDVNKVIAAIAAIVDNWMLAPMQGQASVPAAQVQSVIMAENSRLNHNSQCAQYESLSSAWTAAMCEAGQSDIVIAFGSFYTVAEILNGYRE